jgi:hypothetical protein
LNILYMYVCMYVYALIQVLEAHGEYTCSLLTSVL